MDKAKLRLMAGVGGAILGFIGALAISAGIAVLLSIYIGLAAACMVVGVAFLLIAVGGIAYFVAPFKAAEEEIEQLEHATADALADLPFDTLKSIVEKRPFTTLGVAALAGYAATRDPDNAFKHAQRLVVGML